MLQKRGYRTPARGSTGPGIIGLVTCFGYLFWEFKAARRNQKRIIEIHHEKERRLAVAGETIDEILKQLKAIIDED